jgi:hypothetical protein
MTSFLNLIGKPSFRETVLRTYQPRIYISASLMLLFSSQHRFPLPSIADIGLSYPFIMGTEGASLVLPIVPCIGATTTEVPVHIPAFQLLGPLLLRFLARVTPAILEPTLALIAAVPDFQLSPEMLEQLFTAITFFDGSEPSKHTEVLLLEMIARNNRMHMLYLFIVSAPPLLLLLVTVFRRSSRLPKVIDLFLRFARHLMQNAFALPDADFVLVQSFFSSAIAYRTLSFEN